MVWVELHTLWCHLAAHADQGAVLLLIRMAFGMVSMRRSRPLLAPTLTTNRPALPRQYCRRRNARRRDRRQ